MANTIAIEVKGLRELGERMRLMKSDVALKIAHSATGAAANIVKKAAIRNIQSNDSISGDSIDKGDLLRNVIVKRIPQAQTKLTSEHIVTVRGRGRRSAKKGFVLGAPHAHLVEFGTVNMPAEPFLEPALRRNVEKATEAMKKRLEARIIKAGG